MGQIMKGTRPVANTGGGASLDDEVIQNINETKGLLENEDYGLEAIMNKSSGAVKSVQRGTNTTVGGTASSANITINSVDINKSMVIVNSANSNYANYTVMGELINEQTLQLSSIGNTASSRVKWQVIEFY